MALLYFENFSQAEGTCACSTQTRKQSLMSTLEVSFDQGIHTFVRSLTVSRDRCDLLQEL